jgi:hypothetical protein
MATDCVVATGSTSPTTSSTQSNDLNNNLNNGETRFMVSQQNDNDDKWETVYNHKDKQKLKLNQKNLTYNHRTPFNKSSKNDRPSDSPKSETPSNDTTTNALTNNESCSVSPTQVAQTSPTHKQLIDVLPPPKHNPWAKIPNVKPIKLKGRIKYEQALCGNTII